MKLKTIDLLLILLFVVTACKSGRTVQNEKAAIQLLGVSGGAYVSAVCTDPNDCITGIEDVKKRVFQHDINDDGKDLGISASLNQRQFQARQMLRPKDWAKINEDFYEKSPSLNFGPTCSQAQVTFGFRHYADIKRIQKLLGKPDSQQEGLLLEEKPQSSFGSINQEPYFELKVIWYTYGRLNFAVSPDGDTKGQIFALTAVCKGKAKFEPAHNIIPF